MEALEIINQLGYNSFTKDGIVCITDKNNNDTPLTVSYEEDKIVYTDSTGRKVKINSSGDVEADIGNDLRVSTDKDCATVKLLAHSVTILKINFKPLVFPVDKRDFDIKVEDPINIKYVSKKTFTVDRNGLLIKNYNNRPVENLRNNVDLFMQVLINEITGCLTLVSNEKLEESLGIIYRALEPMVKGRLNLQSKLGGFSSDKYRRKIMGKKQ